MSEISDLAARLTALETVTRQLVTHLAIRADDPPAWVATRKALAMNAVSGCSPEEAAGLRDAFRGFFEAVEAVAAEYAHTQPEGTPRRASR